MIPGNPVVGSTVLRRPAIQSPNFVTTVSGWSINADGSAEFNNLTIRGTFQGINYVLNSSGAFFYSPSEAAGNLIASVAPANGTDAFGNHYLQDLATYTGASACQMTGSDIDFYNGSLAGGWALTSQIVVDSSGNMSVTAGAAMTIFANTGTVDISATSGVTIGGSATTGNQNTSGNTSGPSGTVNSFPAAGPNHTHAYIHNHNL